MATYYFDINNAYGISEPGEWFTKEIPGTFGMLQSLLSGNTEDGKFLVGGDILRLKGYRLDTNSLPITSNNLSASDITLTSYEDNIPYTIQAETTAFFTIYITSQDIQLIVDQGIFGALFFDSGHLSDNVKIKFKNSIVYEEFEYDNILHLEVLGCTFNDVEPLNSVGYDGPEVSACNFDFYDSVFINSMPSDNTNKPYGTYLIQFCTFTGSQSELEINLSAADSHYSFDNCDFDWVSSKTFPGISAVSQNELKYTEYNVDVSSTINRSDFWVDNNVDIGSYLLIRKGRGAFSFVGSVAIKADIKDNFGNLNYNDFYRFDSDSVFVYDTGNALIMDSMGNNNYYVNPHIYYDSDSELYGLNDYGSFLLNFDSEMFGVGYLHRNIGMGLILYPEYINLVDTITKQFGNIIGARGCINIITNILHTLFTESANSYNNYYRDLNEVYPSNIYNNQFDTEFPVGYVFPLILESEIYNTVLIEIYKNKNLFSPFTGITSPPNPGYNFSDPDYDTGLWGFDRV